MWLDIEIGWLDGLGQSFRDHFILLIISASVVAIIVYICIGRMHMVSYSVFIMNYFGKLLRRCQNEDRSKNKETHIM